VHLAILVPNLVLFFGTIVPMGAPMFALNQHLWLVTVGATVLLLGGMGAAIGLGRAGGDVCLPPRNRGDDKQRARGLPQYPALAEVLAPFFAHWARLRDLLAAGWRTPQGDSTLVRAGIGHATNFQTWRSLVREQQLDRPSARGLI
jgi:hypothetical protein